MLWVILVAVVIMGLWVMTALNTHMDELRARQQSQHEEAMAYMRYLKELLSAARSEIRSGAGLPDLGDEFVQTVLKRDT